MVHPTNLVIKMTPSYALLYPSDGFDHSERRFRRIPVAGILNTIVAPATDRHRVEDHDVQEAIQRLDALSIHGFDSPVHSFSSDELAKDLNLEQAVTHLLRPRFTPRFQQHVLEHMPVNLETTLYRQDGMRELIEKPEMAKGIEDGMELFAQLLCAISNRAYAFKHKLSWAMSRRHELKVLTPYNVPILQGYTAMIDHFTTALEGAESGPMQRLRQYFAEVRESGFFKDVHPVFNVRCFKDHMVALDVSVGRDGVPTTSAAHGFQRASRVPTFKFLSQNPLGYVSAFFRTLRLPSTVVMDAMNTAVQRNLDDLLRVGEIVGATEFYTGGAAFYRRMSDIGMPVQLPTVLPKEERRMHLPQARNPLLLYQTGANERDVRRVVPNDVQYDAARNIFVITGSNNGGKTCYVKTGGLLQLLGQNGLPVTAEGEAFLSVVDGLYTHFISPDDIMAGEGRLLNELRRVEEIFRKATPYSYVILDEPCGGTDPVEGARQSLIILDGFHRLGAIVYFTTHLHDVANAIEGGRYTAGKNLHVEIIDDPQSGRPIRTYQVLPGKATSSYGEEVARSVGLTPDGLAAVIAERAEAGDFPRGLLRT